ncbi:MAG: glycosyltransferase family 1 protein [bacterium]|nr:glycosyltransferase family 1 protein [bacterium]
MRIGIDTAPITQHRGRGVGALGHHLLEALLRQRGGNEFVLFSHEAQGASPHGEEGSVRRLHRPGVPAGFSPAWLMDALRLARQVRRSGLDVFHAYFQWNLPLYRYPCPAIGHIYDLMPMAISEIYQERYALPVGRKIWLFRQYLRFALKRVDRVIAISESTRRDLVRLMDYPEGKIDVVYPAPSPEMGPVADAEKLEQMRARYGLPGDYLLYVGGYDYRKNLEMLVAAYLRAREMGLGWPLALAGDMRSPYGRRVRELVETSAGEGAFHLLGHVEDEALPGLYSGAKIALYPSLYEGFGLPVLDAMACGAPVLCADRAAVPEAAGDAALLLPAEDEKAWGEAIFRLAESAGLREEMRQKGLAHARRFTWENAARDTIRVYETAAGSL